MIASGGSRSPGWCKSRRLTTSTGLKALPAVSQETTLMCISNGLDAA